MSGRKGGNLGGKSGDPGPALGNLGLHPDILREPHSQTMICADMCDDMCADMWAL